MARKDSMDRAGAAGMVVFATLLAANQVVVKLTNAGIAPVWGAGLRSVLALVVLALWCLATGRRPRGITRTLWPGLLLGGLFSFEFLVLFVALDLTTVSRSAILFYSMPVWFAVIAHLFLPGERLTPRRLLGLGLAMAGVVWALSDPQSRDAGNWLGDGLALLACFAWIGIALTVRLTRLAHAPAETQLFWQLTVSAVVLCLVAPLFGPMLRGPEWWHWAGLGAQAVFVASLGFLFWLHLMTIYPASDIAAFSFLSPVLSVGLGWALLDEPVGPGFLGALALVSVGIVLVTVRRRRPVVVPEAGGI
ncbi:DMT family transporter [Thetidibacter halocola]|uniref:DMT family transporter n=1 Tax=Thetidibacter halocola TaxID=2827239 RepID=A0A8J8B6V9_9RHOB|nr:DMT family transporter [Thetidibacter halocola]MBS0123049.1 DMT family transporter [Thetidibacter halocola]